MMPMCHPTRRHEAKGLCKSCYNTVARRANGKPRLRTTGEVERNREAARRAYWRDPEAGKARSREHRLRTRYNTTGEEVAGKLEQQGNACAICNRPLTSRPCVDHDHKTGQPRGILCIGCNVLVGVLEHELRPVAEAYIESWQYQPLGASAEGLAQERDTHRDCSKQGAAREDPRGSQGSRLRSEVQPQHRPGL